MFKFKMVWFGLIGAMALIPGMAGATPSAPAYALDTFQVSFGVACSKALAPVHGTAVVVIPQVPEGDHNHYFSAQPPREDRYTVMDVMALNACDPQGATAVHFLVRNVNEHTFLVETDRPKTPKRVWLTGQVGTPLVLPLPGEATLHVSVTLQKRVPYPSADAAVDAYIRLAHPLP